jgi:hypothetical protein
MHRGAHPHGKFHGVILHRSLAARQLFLEPGIRAVAPKPTAQVICWRSRRLSTTFAALVFEARHLIELFRVVYRAVTAAQNGPTIYELCDPLLRGSGSGNQHLRQVYKVAIRNPPLARLLARAGLPQLRDEARRQALQQAIVAARDEVAPDWQAIGSPLAALLDDYSKPRPKPRPRTKSVRPVSLNEIETIIRACATNLLRSFARNSFIPGYAAFNLTGDPDFGGAELLIALQGLNARSYKNSTFLFNLVRPFIAASPAAALFNRTYTGVAEQMWMPVQIRHRSAYYDAFFAEALMDFLDSGLAPPPEASAARRAIEHLIGFCLTESRERVRDRDGKPFDVITGITPAPHVRINRLFSRVRADLGFSIYVPDCDTTACSFSAAAQSGSQQPILDQPLIDFYAGYQVGQRDNRAMLTVPINDTMAFDGAILTWIDNLDGARPFGNDVDPTLNLDVLDACFRHCERWQIAQTPERLATVRRIIQFQRTLTDSGAFANPRSHIYYLPELYCAYFGRCHAALRALPRPVQQALDPDDSFAAIARRVLEYVRDDLITAEMNAFDAALCLLALAKLGAEPASFAPSLSTLADSFGEGGRRDPFKAYEWNKMKTPTRIVVGGPEVTSAFVLSALVHARRAMAAAGAT